jgi:Myb-like DNA-binding domain
VCKAKRRGGWDMEKKKRPWTEEEDQLILEVVQTSIEKGQSKRDAFEKAAAKIKRSPGTCSHRYYTKLHKQPSEISLESCIAFLQKGMRGGEEKENKLLLNEKEKLLLKQNELKKRYIAYSEKHEKLKAMLSLLKEAEVLDKNPGLPSPIIH